MGEDFGGGRVAVQEKEGWGVGFGARVGDVDLAVFGWEGEGGHGGFASIV